MALTAAHLLESARCAPPGSAEWVLYSAAAFDALVRSPLVLVGGAAQVIHTAGERPTAIDMVGLITPLDERTLADAGFVREGRHWIYHWAADQGIAVEVPSNSLLGEETPELIDVGGRRLRVISVNDLMMDRLMQATDGTAITWEEALSLGVAARDRVNWQSLKSRCLAGRTADIGLNTLPEVLDRLLRELA